MRGSRPVRPVIKVTVQYTYLLNYTLGANPLGEGVKVRAPLNRFESF